MVQLRFLPDLPSATISTTTIPSSGSCGSSPISHRLQWSGRNNAPVRLLRFLPDLPSATIIIVMTVSMVELRFLPDLPSATINATGVHRTASVAVPPRSPIGYNVPARPCCDYSVAVPPRSPIGYNGYGSGKTYFTLRFLPDLPSATIGLSASRLATKLRFLPDLPSATIARILRTEAVSCGSSPISHRLQLSHLNTSICSTLRFLPDLPSATIPVNDYWQVQQLRFLPDLPSATIHRLPDDTWLKAGLAGQKPQKSGVNGLRTVCTVLDFCWLAAA